MEVDTIPNAASTTELQRGGSERSSSEITSRASNVVGGGASSSRASGTGTIDDDRRGYELNPSSSAEPVIMHSPAGDIRHASTSISVDPGESNSRSTHPESLHQNPDEHFYQRQEHRQQHQHHHNDNQHGHHRHNRHHHPSQPQIEHSQPHPLVHESTRIPDSQPPTSLPRAQASASSTSVSMTSMMMMMMEEVARAVTPHGRHRNPSTMTDDSSVPEPRRHQQPSPPARSLSPLSGIPGRSPVVEDDGHRSNMSSSNSEVPVSSNQPAQPFQHQHQHQHHQPHHLGSNEVMLQLGSRYQAIRVIGYGSGGVVVEVRDTTTDTKCAIKKIAQFHSYNTKDGLRILREVVLQRCLQHPNILSVKEVLKPLSYAQFRDLYIVTPLMDTNLKLIIDSRQELSVDHIRYFMFQILCGLDFLHSLNIVHRDLKPENVLVNENCDVRLCDLGLARFLDSAEQQTANMTAYVSTRWYRAPELLFQETQYSSAIDVWSAGCIMAELFNRRPLYPGKHFLQQLQMIFATIGTPTDDYLDFLSHDEIRQFVHRLPKRDPLPWSDFIPGAPVDACELLSQLLALDPRKRISAKVALDHPFLAVVREQCPIPEGQHDPFPQSLLQLHAAAAGGSDISMDKLKACLYDEVLVFHPNALQEEQDRYKSFLALAQATGSSQSALQAVWSNLTNNIVGQPQYLPLPNMFSIVPGANRGPNPTGPAAAAPSANDSAAAGGTVGSSSSSHPGTVDHNQKLEQAHQNTENLHESMCERGPSSVEKPFVAAEFGRHASVEHGSAHEQPDVIRSSEENTDTNMDRTHQGEGDNDDDSGMRTSDATGAIADVKGDAEYEFVEPMKHTSSTPSLNNCGLRFSTSPNFAHPMQPGAVQQSVAGPSSSEPIASAHSSATESFPAPIPTVSPTHRKSLDGSSSAGLLVRSSIMRGGNPPVSTIRTVTPPDSMSECSGSTLSNVTSSYSPTSGVSSSTSTSSSSSSSSISSSTHSSASSTPTAPNAPTVSSIMAPGSGIARSVAFQSHPHHHVDSLLRRAVSTPSLPIIPPFHQHFHSPLAAQQSHQQSNTSAVIAHAHAQATDMDRPQISGTNTAVNRNDPSPSTTATSMVASFPTDACNRLAQSGMATGPSVSNSRNLDERAGDIEMSANGNQLRPSATGLQKTQQSESTTFHSNVNAVNAVQSPQYLSSPPRTDRPVSRTPMTTPVHEATDPTLSNSISPMSLVHRLAALQTETAGSSLQNDADNVLSNLHMGTVRTPMFTEIPESIQSSDPERQMMFLNLSALQMQRYIRYQQQQLMQFQGGDHSKRFDGGNARPGPGGSVSDGDGDGDVDMLTDP